MDQLSIKQKAAFGIGAIGKDIVYALSASFVMYFYQDVMGLSAAFVGLILMIARVFDAVNDPVMGVLVGKTRTRWGRFRPWLFTGTVVNAFVLYAMFAAPSLEGTGLMVYFSVTYILWGLTYTMMDIPFWSMIPAVTRSLKSRENLSVIGRTCAGIGSMILTSSAMLLVTFLGNGNEQEGFKWLALIVAVVFVIAEVACCLGFKENSPVSMEKTSVKDMFKALFKNDQAMVIVVAVTMFYLASFVLMNLLIYFFKYDFGGADWQVNFTLFTTVGSICQMVGMLLVYPILRKKFTNPQIFSGSLVGMMVGFAALLAVCLAGFKTSIVALLAAGVVIFTSAGMIVVLITLFLANSVDYGQIKTGKREESMIFSMQTFVVKAGSGFAVFLAGLGIDAIGLVGADSAEIVAQSASTLLGLEVIMTVPSIICLGLALFFFKRNWKITDQRAREMADEIAEMESLESARQFEDAHHVGGHAERAEEIAAHVAELESRESREKELVESGK